ncbi:hypothetical protein [Oryza sativa Japonica Group]|uniref:Uncharacterized protein n=1 Tax=Oryza sativa subsp. japonica TaxID=39947 RepID=Q5VP07_ORYSJ|nr:hypothetical protein [Oryza sativa Japonica Group]
MADGVVPCCSSMVVSSTGWARWWRPRRMDADGKVNRDYDPDDFDCLCFLLPCPFDVDRVAALADGSWHCSVRLFWLCLDSSDGN